MGCGCTGFGGDGFGAYFKDRAGRSPFYTAKAGRVVGTDKWGRAIATDGFGAYYLAVPGQMFSGFGAVQGFEFDAAAVWSDWVAGAAKDCDYKNNQALCVIRAKRAVNSIRAALGYLGYGTSVMSVSWGSADQANYKQWAADSGQESSNGMPQKAHLELMQQQISQGMKPGPEKAVAYVIGAGGEIYEKAKAVVSGMSTRTWLLIGAGALLVGGLIYMKKRKKSQYTSYKKTTAIEPYRGGGQMQPAYSANRRRARKNGRKYRRRGR